MWIVCKHGLVNTDNVTSIAYVDGKTVCSDSGDSLFIISDRPVVADILVALQNGEKFLEVE